MRPRSLTSVFCTLPLAASIAVLTSAFAAGQTAQVLHRFSGSSDGQNPAGNLVFDGAGNLYGTTEYGGVNGYYGTVFQLLRPAKPTDPWVENTLYSFKNDGDGARPTCGLVFDSMGNLYGATSDSNAGGYGEIFELSPPATKGGAWTEKVLYHFTGGTDGAYPDGGLIWDPAGNLYGATSSSVFELSPPVQKDGAWTFTLLHDFVCCTSDGWNSTAGLVRDGAGNLYGTTEWGGSYTGQYCDYIGCGTVFEVSPPAAPGDPWTETVLYRFGGEPDGLNPFSALTLDQSGNLYGNTYGGGALQGGTAFKLAPPSQPGGAWTKTIIHNFSYSSSDGAVPTGTMVFDKAGNLWGTARFGGNTCYFNTGAYGCGAVFELSPPDWSETSLYKFVPYGPAPLEPEGGVIIDGNGHLYGTTTYGGFPRCIEDGSDQCGTVFELTP